MTADRSTKQVIADHLAKRRDGDVDGDLDDNYADDVVVLSHLGHFRGRDQVRTLAALLDQQLEDAVFHYDTVLVDGDYAFLHWSAQARDLHVSDGADSFVVRGGRIAMQTIYYSISTNPGAPSSIA